MYVLGIDYGRRRLGLAIAKDGFPEPFLILRLPNKAKNDRFGYFIQQVFLICQKEKIEKIIVGFSRSNPDFENEVKNFANQLQEKTDLEVVFFEESMTTKEAQELMIRTGYNKRRRKEEEDAVAAALLLEDYLQQQNQKLNTKD